MSSISRATIQIADIAVVDAELSAYGRGLLERPRLFALNKFDLYEARERAAAVAESLGPDTIVVSAVSGEHVPDLLKRIFATCPPRDLVATATAGERRILFSGGGRDWTVKKEKDGFRVRGERVERLASGIDWESPDAAAYFQRLLQKQGIEKELRRLGVSDGDTVRIGAKELEWTEARSPVRLGVFGGTFDPVHVGHLAIAHAALESVPLDRVLFVIARRSPLKERGAGRERRGPSADARARGRG